MHTIALVSKKGGTGKSTLAIGLAIAAMQDGHKVCLLEADPQGTVSNWHRRGADAARKRNPRSRPLPTTAISRTVCRFSNAAASRSPSSTPPAATAR